MNLITKVLLSFFVISCLLLVQSQSSAYAAFLTVTSPNGGESYTVGQNVHITWDTDSTGNCSLYFTTPEAGPFTSYFVGNASASAKAFDWTAYTPISTTSAQQEKIQIVCVGTPVDYSDNYFSVLPPSQPVCDRAVQVAFTDISTPSIYRGGSITNQVAVTNPNDAACGASVYGLSNSYPGGWSMTLPFSVTVNPGETKYAPLTLTSSSSAAYQTYNYSVFAGGSSGGVLVPVTGHVNVVPRCDATVQASLSALLLPMFPGESKSNALVLTNPNLPECSTKTYTYSYVYPSAWNLSIQPNVTVSSGQTVSVPFSITSDPSASIKSHRYDFYVYNAWADGSGQAQVTGIVQIHDNTSPTVSITSPVNNSQVAKRSTVSIAANASDNVGVTKVEFYVNGELTCTDTTASYSCSFDTTNRKRVPYTITAKAYDAANNSSSTTSYVTTK